MAVLTRHVHFVRNGHTWGDWPAARRMPPITIPEMPVILAMPNRSRSVASTVNCSRRRPARTRWSTRLTKAPRQEWSSTARPAALAALRMAALACQRPTR
eukprot:312880-Alexandrium_andersonii.AAC.1